VALTKTHTGWNARLPSRRREGERPTSGWWGRFLARPAVHDPGKLALPLRILLAACVVLVMACTRGGETFGPPKRARTGNTFYVGGGAEPESIDPGKTYDAPGFMVSRNLFEGLMRPDPVTLAPLPGVASSYEESDDGKRFVFHLRPDARWSDGAPVTAHDFEWSWKRVLDPATAAQYAGLLWDLKNGKAYAEGRAPADAVGVRAKDDRTLLVELERAVPWFVDLLTFGPFQPVPRHAIERHGMAWTRPENIVTNGPFHLDKWVISYQIEIAKSPTYWGADEVKLDRVVFVVSDDNHAMMRLFRAGELDWIGPDVRPPQEYLEHLASKKDFRSDRDLATYFYLINLRADAPEPLRDKRVRKALDMSIDKEAMARFVMKGGERPARTLVPDLFVEQGYAPPPGNPYDPEEARRLLREAGYGPGGKPFGTLEVLYNTHDAHRQVAEALQAMWKRELGIDVQLVNQEWKVFMNNRLEGYFQLARAGWTGDFQDPYSFLSMFLSDSEQNETRWVNEEYDALVREALEHRDRAERYALYAKAEAILLEELPMIPLYYYAQNTLLGSWVKGWHPNSQDIHPFRDVWLENEE